MENQIGIEDLFDEEEEVQEKHYSRRDVILWAAGLAVGVVVVLAAVAALMLPLTSGKAAEFEGGAGVPGCDQRVEDALTMVEQSCLSLGLEEVCYGNNTLHAQLLDDGALRFEVRGDVIPAEILRTLDASPLNRATGEWGIAVFKVRSTLPRTLPGQAVTFLVFGDTTLNIQPALGTGSSLHAFYFSTGLGSVDCQSVAVDGILVQTPAGSATQLRANGVDLTISGTMLLEAAPNDEMTVSMVEGLGRVQAHGGTQDIGGGQAVTIPLGGKAGLEASGTPSQPQAIEPGAAETGCTMTGGCASSINVPGNVTAKIDALLASQAAAPTPTAPSLNESLIDLAATLGDRFATPDYYAPASSGGYCGGSCIDSSQCADGMACFNGVCWNAQVCESGGGSMSDTSSDSGGGSGGGNNRPPSSGSTNDSQNCTRDDDCYHREYNRHHRHDDDD